MAARRRNLVSDMCTMLPYGTAICCYAYTNKQITLPFISIPFIPCSAVHFIFFLRCIIHSFLFTVYVFSFFILPYPAFCRTFPRCFRSSPVLSVSSCNNVASTSTEFPIPVGSIPSFSYLFMFFLTHMQCCSEYFCAVSRY